MFNDPDKIFDMMAPGKDVIEVNSLNDFVKPLLQKTFEQAGMTIADGKVTREQYRAAFEKTRGSRPGGGGGGPGGGGPGGFSPDAMAEAAFRKLDVDGDGMLKAEEMVGSTGEALLAERDKWDANQDGFIELSEFKPFFAARMQQMQKENGGGRERASRDDRKDPDDEDSDRRPVVVYRSGSLPKDIPAWFAQLDTDQDAQISLFEWRKSGRSIEEFKAMDRSGDNLLTVEEVLLFVRLQKMENAVAGNSDGPGTGPGKAPGMNFSFPGANGQGFQNMNIRSFGTGTDPTGGRNFNGNPGNQRRGNDPGAGANRPMGPGGNRGNGDGSGAGGRGNRGNRGGTGGGNSNELDD